MTIVHVVYSMEVGGAESLVAQLCRLQRQQGHTVSVIAQGTLGVLGEHLRAEGFRVEVAGTGHPLLRFPRWLELFRELRPEVVHCHNPAPTIQAAPAARLSGARTIVSTRHSLVAPPYNRKEETLYGVAARFCTWIVGICEATCVNLSGAPLARARHIVRVYNGCAALPRVPEGDAAELWAEAEGTAGARERDQSENAPARPTLFLFVGRVAAIKDLATLLRAFAEACALTVARGVTEATHGPETSASTGSPEDAPLRLWIVGDGPERQKLEALAHSLGVAHLVRFWGERHDVARFFAAADVFTMSSVSEGLPMSLLQAMSVGLPALVTDVGGMAEVVRLAEGGITTPVGNSRAMADAMLHLADDGALRERMGQSARKTYEEQFTLERMGQGYQSLYGGSRPGAARGSG